MQTDKQKFQIAFASLKQIEVLLKNTYQLLEDIPKEEEEEQFYLCDR